VAKKKKKGVIILSLFLWSLSSFLFTLIFYQIKNQLILGREYCNSFKKKKKKGRKRCQGEYSLSANFFFFFFFFFKI